MAPDCTSSWLSGCKQQSSARSRSHQHCCSRSEPVHVPGAAAGKGPVPPGPHLLQASCTQLKQAAFRYVPMVQTTHADCQLQPALAGPAMPGCCQQQGAHISPWPHPHHLLSLQPASRLLRLGSFAGRGSFWAAHSCLGCWSLGCACSCRWGTARRLSSKHGPLLLVARLFAQLLLCLHCACMSACLLSLYCVCAPVWGMHTSMRHALRPLSSCATRSACVLCCTPRSVQMTWSGAGSGSFSMSRPASWPSSSTIWHGWGTLQCNVQES
jgi:hypothetical protein